MGIIKNYFIIYEPQSFRESLLQGVFLGIKWISIIMLPIMAIGIVGETYESFHNHNLGESINNATAFQLFWELVKIQGNILGAYMVCCFWGVVAGTLVCPLVYLHKSKKKKRDNCRQINEKAEEASSFVKSETKVMEAE